MWVYKYDKSIDCRSLRLFVFFHISPFPLPATSSPRIFLLFLSTSLYSVTLSSLPFLLLLNLSIHLPTCEWTGANGLLTVPYQGVELMGTKLGLAPSNKGLFFGPGYDTGVEMQHCKDKPIGCIELIPCSTPGSCLQVCSCCKHLCFHWVMRETG